VAIGALGTVALLLVPPTILLSPLILVLGLVVATSAGPGRVRSLAVGATIAAVLGVVALGFLASLWR
jgi:hypothetical protein